MNPRIQVEHTVTEEITDVDLVALNYASRRGRADRHGSVCRSPSRSADAALQCRITTENPAENGFRPDVGRITVYRSPGGTGVMARRWHQPGRRGRRSLRLDAGQAHLPRPGVPDRGAAGAVPSPSSASAGVWTNIPSLRGGSRRPGLPGGGITTSFIDDRPSCLRCRRVGRPGQQDPVVPGRRHRQQAARRAAHQGVSTRQAAAVDRHLLASPPAGSRQRLGRWDRRFCRRPARQQTARRYRHHVPRRAPSLLATRIRTSGLIAVAPYIAALTPSCCPSNAGAARPTTWRCAF